MSDLLWLNLGLILVSSSAMAGPRICALPDGGNAPAEVVAATERPDGPIQPRGGFADLTEQIRQNRLELAAGLIGPSEAEQRGGTAVSGTKEVPVFLVKFSDTGSDPVPASDLQDQLFGTWPTGTMTNYYQEVSYGAFTVTGTVYDWTALAEDDSYYEGGTGCYGLCGSAEIGELIEETLDANDAHVDFGDYDNDGPDGVANSGDDDGYVDFVGFVHAEEGAECGAESIWSHRWVLSGWTGSSYETDDASASGGKVRINDYVIMPIFACGGTDMIEIGVFCHEFGHAFGLPDLYDTNSSDGSSAGIGHWGLMGSGNWNEPASPAHMTAFSKERLGWLSYFNVTTDIEDLCLPPVETHAVAVRFWSSGGDGPEYFVAENRQAIGFDANLHGTGLVIYHVDEDEYDLHLSSNRVNGDETHKGLDVECADATSASHGPNSDDLDAGLNRGDSGDVWCPSTSAAFDGSSVPDTRAYSGTATGVAVRDIDSCGSGEICADYEVGVASTADLCMHDCHADGCAEITTCDMWWATPDIWIDNDDDGVDDYPADGIENHLWFRVKNTGPEALSDVRVDLYYADPAAGQLWPSTAEELIGSKEISILDAGEVYEDYVIFEYPSPPASVKHYCVGAIAVHALDPQNSESPPNDNNVVQVNHQILVSRPEGTSMAPCPGPFVEASRIELRTGDATEPFLAEVRVGTPPTFSDFIVPPHWSYDISPDAGPFPMSPGDVRTITVYMTSNAANEFDFARLPITLWDLTHGEAVGGVNLRYEIDCNNAQPPATIQATWTEEFPDDLNDETVLVQWPKVTRDVVGVAEIVKFYEVWRSDDRPTAEELVARVAIDAEPSLGGFQWYDRVPRDCDVHYAYRVRAIDAAGGAGAFSLPGVTSCEITDLSDQAGPGLPGGSWPNPFRSETTVRFHLPQPGVVELGIFDVRGQRVRKLVSEPRNPGPFEAVWDGCDDSGRRLPSGTYFARIVGPGIEARRTLVLTR